MYVLVNVLQCNNVLLSLTLANRYMKRVWSSILWVLWQDRYISNYLECWKKSWKVLICCWTFCLQHSAVESSTLVLLNLFDLNFRSKDSSAVESLALVFSCREWGVENSTLGLTLLDLNSQPWKIWSLF